MVAHTSGSVLDELLGGNCVNLGSRLQGLFGDAGWNLGSGQDELFGGDWVNLGYKGQLEFIFQDKNIGVYNYVKNKSIHRISDLVKNIQ